MSRRRILGMAEILAVSIGRLGSSIDRALVAATLSLTGFVIVWLGLS
jgi:hypothetical protein